MNYEQLEKHFGSQVEIQRALGVKHRQTVNKWKRAGVPLDWQVKAEIASDGELKADLPKAFRKLAA